MCAETGDIILCETRMPKIIDEICIVCKLDCSLTGKTEINIPKSWKK